jgi:hypothetical protein
MTTKEQLPYYRTTKVVLPDGSQMYRLKGRFHRLDGPALIDMDGTEEWYKHGLRHRLDGPAIICPDGDEIYYIEGEMVYKENFEEAVLLYKCKQILES